MTARRTHTLLAGASATGRFRGVEEDLDEYLVRYNTRRRHQGLRMVGRTPYDVFLDGLKNAPPAPEEGGTEAG